MYEHNRRSDGSVEEVSIGYLLAKKGLAKCSDYENVKDEESDNHDEESSEFDKNLLECKESELSLAASETGVESKSSPSSDLLEKILASSVGCASTPVAKQKLLTPSELLMKSDCQSSKNCDLEGTDTEPGSSTTDNESGSSSQNLTTGNESSHDQGRTSPQTVLSDHATNVTSAVTDSTPPEVNQDSVESSV